MQEQFYGKYRGEVANAIDPLGLGRVQVSVPDVLGDGRNAWAMPCTPFAGPSVGFFAVPPVGANVWIEFERGDPDYPIWSGCFWGPNQAPVAAGPQQVLTQALVGQGYKIEVLDVPGAPSVSIAATLPTGEASVVIDASGMTLTWGQSTVALTVDSVSVNGSNLKVLSTP